MNVTLIIWHQIQLTWFWTMTTTIALECLNKSCRLASVCVFFKFCINFLLLFYSCVFQYHIGYIVWYLFDWRIFDRKNSKKFSQWKIGADIFTIVVVCLFVRSFVVFVVLFSLSLSCFFSLLIIYDCDRCWCARLLLPNIIQYQHSWMSL